MKISYSNYKNYLECPKKYYFITNYIQPPEKPDKYFALYGLLVESFFNLYTNKILKNNITLTEKDIKDILLKNWKEILLNNYVNWKNPWVKETPTDIFNSAYNDILENMKKIDFWKNAYAETTINIFLNTSRDLITGRIDFIINNPDGNVEIIDGKGTYKMEQTVDLEQLYFYILLYYLHYKKLPKKAGFLYYKYQTLCYIDYDIKTISDFKDKFLLTVDLIKKDTTFKAIVNINKQCKWCPYRELCNSYIQKRNELDFKNSKIEIDPNFFINFMQGQGEKT